MLANARTFGYVFDPLSVFWCYAADGTLEGVLAEVHNTYGERHGYVVELDEQRPRAADKELYVSPFFGVFGDYQLQVRTAAATRWRVRDAQAGRQGRVHRQLRRRRRIRSLQPDRQGGADPAPDAAPGRAP